MPSRTRRRSASLGFTALLVITFALAFAAPLRAQVVSDPRIAEFDPSPDHWVMLDSGQPAVLRYELSMYSVGASAPFAMVDMGKPAPESDGKIRYNFTSAAAGWPFPGGSYEARVSAVGPEGAALSDPSNPFTFSTSSSCTYSLSPASVRAPASGGSYSVGVTTGTTCSWIATSALPWVSVWVTSGSSSGTVPFQVQANTSSSSRSGTLMIGGKSVTISQDAATTTTTKTTPTLTWATPAAITQGTPLSATQLNATANVAGTFVYNPAAGTVLAAGTFSLKTTFYPTDTSRYATATAYTNLSVIAVQYRLTVSRPTGGTVYASGIRCGTMGTACSITMPAAMNLGVEASPDSGYAFAGWTGDCIGTNPTYALLLNGPKSCSATFRAVSTTTGSSTPLTDGSGLSIGAPYTLTIVRPSGGIVKAAGISCGTNNAACQITMPAPMNLGLQATADAGYVFAGWTGNCSGTNGAYQLALEGARTCGASFSPSGSSTVQPPPTTTTSGGTLPVGAPYTLTVQLPTGGTVRAAGIVCGTQGTTCAVTMPAALWLGLEAIPAPGYVFTGWGGHCSGTQSTYAISLAGARTCSATFAVIK
jgi:hypothetical protein